MTRACQRTACTTAVAACPAGGRTNLAACVCGEDFAHGAVFEKNSKQHGWFPTAFISQRRKKANTSHLLLSGDIAPLPSAPVLAWPPGTAAALLRGSCSASLLPVETGGVTPSFPHLVTCNRYPSRHFNIFSTVGVFFGSRRQLYCRHHIPESEEGPETPRHRPWHQDLSCTLGVRADILAVGVVKRLEERRSVEADRQRKGRRGDTNSAINRHTGTEETAPARGPCRGRGGMDVVDENQGSRGIIGSPVSGLSLESRALCRAARVQYRRKASLPLQSELVRFRRTTLSVTCSRGLRACWPG